MLNYKGINLKYNEAKEEVLWVDKPSEEMFLKNKAYKEKHPRFSLYIEDDEGNVINASKHISKEDWENETVRNMFLDEWIHDLELSNFIINALNNGE